MMCHHLLQGMFLIAVSKSKSINNFGFYLETVVNPSVLKYWESQLFLVLGGNY